jgi:nucleoside-diphosphate-sugar epimerase
MALDGKGCAMRVLVIGATGQLGRPAVRRLLADGHDVTGLARDGDRAAVVAGLGVQAVVGDLFDPDSLLKALVGREAVLNLATRIPPMKQAMLGRGWAANDHVRADGSAALVTAALASQDVRIIVQEGITFYYADAGDAEITEESAIDVPNALRSTIVAHQNVARFAGDGRVGVRLRIGGLVGDDPATHTLRRLARFGVPVIFGDPNGWTAAIHPSDAATGAVAALAAPSGIYNVTAPPVRKRDYGTAIARAGGARKARSIPPALLRAMGPAATLGRSQRVVSTKLTDATGWQPALPVMGPEWFAAS